MYEALFLHRSLPFASALMPQTVQRIRAFCDRFDTDTKPDEIGEQVWRMFGSADRRLGLWVVVKDRANVVAHLMAQPEPVDLAQGPWSYVLIRQAEVDRREDTRSINRDIAASVREWTRSLGLSRLLLLTHRRGAVVARRWGFRPYKLLMEQRFEWVDAASAEQQPTDQ